MPIFPKWIRIIGSLYQNIELVDNCAFSDRFGFKFEVLHFREKSCCFDMKKAVTGSVPDPKSSISDPDPK